MKIYIFADMEGMNTSFNKFSEACHVLGYRDEGDFVRKHIAICKPVHHVINCRITCSKLEYALEGDGHEVFTSLEYALTVNIVYARKYCLHNTCTCKSESR